MPGFFDLLMALWKISDVWMESSAPGTLDRSGISNELALAVNPRLVIVRVSTYGQYGKEDYLGRPGYDAIAQASVRTTNRRVVLRIPVAIGY